MGALGRRINGTCGLRTTRCLSGTASAFPLHLLGIILRGRGAPDLSQYPGVQEVGTGWSFKALSKPNHAGTQQGAGHPLKLFLRFGTPCPAGKEPGQGRRIQVRDGAGKGQRPASPREPLPAPPRSISANSAQGFKHPLKLICWIKPFLHSLH